MTSRDIDLRTQWQPPPRPDWVQRINDEGRCMDIRSVVPLDEDSLLAAARQSTGLSDFGDDDWREPFRILVRDFDTVAELNLIGRLRTRSELLQLLTARLQIEDWYRRFPEIDAQRVSQPIFVVGQGRSGTSYLINLLASDPENGALMQWEAMFPCPPPERATYDSDPRIERAHHLIDQWNRVTPTLTSMHEFAGNVPMEDCQIMGLSFRAPSWFGSLGQAPNYDAYMAQQDPAPALRHHQRVLKLLQWRNPRKRWVLKDPMHLDRMTQLLEVYPDARFVWPHRDPVRALASTVSLIGTIQWGRSDHPFKGGSFEFVTDPAYSARRFEAVIEQLAASRVPKERICHVLYRDLVRDPIGTIAATYRHLGVDFPEGSKASIERYVAHHPRDHRATHRFNAGDAETIARTRAVYRRYQEYFGIPDE